ncbi:hypothetical protein E2320_012751 [Naja naja]|nr:hypothetical protein E2320_012751 [Naja naja]
MGGCFSKPKPVEVKIEVVLPEKERIKEEASPNGKASPIVYKANGTSRHYQLEEHPVALNPYRNVKDVVEASDARSRPGLWEGSAGVLSKGRVRCPWHGACFNISTGDIEDFPGLDSIPKFQAQKRTKVMAKCISLSNYSISSTNVLIIGAGPAGLVCAETLRQEGFSDRIVMCTIDRHLPYDRPKLSKVAAVDVKNKTAIFKDGFKMEYNKLLLATGNTCQPGGQSGHWQKRRGGMEVAAYLSEKAHSVSVVELEEVPFRKSFGEKVGRAIMKARQLPGGGMFGEGSGLLLRGTFFDLLSPSSPLGQMFENNRVKFYMQTELKEVVLKSGKVLRADVCVIGIGATPATGFLKQSGVHLDSKGFIVVNKMMQTNIPGVFAAGDAVAFPLALRNHKKTNVPHWQMAHMHGRIAALNMLAYGTEISTVPYLWTAMFGKSIRYAGHGEGFDDVIIRGDLDELKFVAFYTKSDEVLAVASMNYDPLVSKVADVMGSGRAIRKRDVE